MAFDWGTLAFGGVIGGVIGAAVAIVVSFAAQRLARRADARVSIRELRASAYADLLAARRRVLGASLRRSNAIHDATSVATAAGRAVDFDFEGWDAQLAPLWADLESACRRVQVLGSRRVWSLVGPWEERFPTEVTMAVRPDEDRFDAFAERDQREFERPLLELIRRELRTDR